METVLASIIVIFLILFAVLTLSQALVSAQDVLGESWQEMEARLAAQTRTRLTVVDAYSGEMGTVLTFVLRNDGAVRLSDFERWDVFAQYYDGSDTYHVGWLPYSTSVPTANEWTVAGIYLDEGEAVDEVFEPGICNPGEALVLQLRVSPAVAPGAAIQTTLATPNGISASTVFTGNYPPLLVSNLGLAVASGATGVINTAQLETTDEDGLPADLVYTVTVPPTQGALSLGDTFTQIDLDSGLLSYTHTGSGDDGFQFSVSDGHDTIGTYFFEITVSVSPVMMTNLGLTIASGGAGLIDSTLLETTDADNLPAELSYTVTSAPMQGALSLGSAFTQGDINGGLLSYTHTGSGSDSFAFTVSDGVSTIGPYTFPITVP